MLLILFVFNSSLYNFEKIKVNSQVHQLWFDFYSDYTLKYHYPTQFNLKGMGIYRLDYLDYENESQSKTTDYMWRLLPKF